MLTLAVILATASPLLRDNGACPPGYSSVAHCVPNKDVKPAISPKHEIDLCPTGYTSMGRYCTKSDRR